MSRERSIPSTRWVSSRHRSLGIYQGSAIELPSGTRLQHAGTWALPVFHQETRRKP